MKVLEIRRKLHRQCSFFQFYIVFLMKEVQNEIYAQRKNEFRILI